jgi:hypothetical protein
MSPGWTHVLIFLETVSMVICFYGEICVWVTTDLKSTIIIWQIYHVVCMSAMSKYIYTSVIKLKTDKEEEKRDYKD